MSKDKMKITSSRIFQVVAIVVALATAGPTLAQSASPQQAQTASPAAQDYKIGTDDVLTVSVLDAPEFGGKLRVSDTGQIAIPGVKAPIQAEGLSTTELSQSIRQALLDAKQLRDPRVTVFVDEYHGRTVTVLGAVARPAEYPLQKRTSVVEALSLAGGTLPTAGNVITVVRGPASAEATNTQTGSVNIIEMNKVLKGEDSLASLEVRNGDVVSVATAPVIYVVGAVTKPGGYAMADPSSGVSAVQAVALAQGFNSVASTHRALIVRQSTSTAGRVEIPVDLGLMMAGKTTDVPLAPNDILYIPSSGTKRTLKAMGEVAMAAATGVAYYGLGYKVGAQ